MLSSASLKDLSMALKIGRTKANRVNEGERVDGFLPMRLDKAWGNKCAVAMRYNANLLQTTQSV